MSRNKEPKPVTWPWIITACLMPVLVGATVMVFVYNAKRDAHLPRIDVAAAKLREFKPRLEAITARMSPVIQKSGVDAPIPAAAGFTSQDLEPLPVIAKEEPTAVHQRWSQFQSDYRNNPEYGIAAMRAQKARYATWNQSLSKTLAHLIYNDRYGTGATDAVAAEGTVQVSRLVAETRSLVRTSTVGGLSLDDNQVVQAYDKYMKKQASLDPRVPVSGTTLQSIVSLQRDLIRTLSAVTEQQYAAAYQAAGGWSRFEDRTAAIDAEFAKLKTAIEGSAGSTDGVISSLAASFAELTRLETAAKTNIWAEQAYAINISRDTLLSDIGRRNTDFDAEVRASETDAFEFQRLLQENKLIGKESVLTTTLKPDATVRWVNRATKECRIDLGSADNIEPGMRFEVWQFGGQGREYQKAMIEVVRVLSPTFSLCTILDMVESDDPVREGDAAVNVLWENGKYLSVALHGKGWDAASTKYGKFRLKDILQNMGVTVHDALNPNTDAVILGMQWGLDPVYNEAKKHIVRDTYSEKRIRLYIDPR